MKTMVIGDTHGRISRVIDIILANNEINHIVHLGDMAKDAETLMDAFPHLLFTVVEGNNEWHSQFPKETIIEIGSKRVFATHGHLYGVKSTYVKLLHKVKKLNVDIALFAHTHIKYDKKKEGITLLNPSSHGYILIGEDGDYEFFDL